MPPAASFNSSLPRRQKKFARGSALIVALLFAGLIAIALGTLLSLNLTTARLSKRSLNGYAALNLSEAGLEEGVWSLNRSVANDPDAWTDWTQSGGSAWRKFPGFGFGPNTDGDVKVYIDVYDPVSGRLPKVVALASVNPPGQPAVIKMIEATMKRRSYFPNGLVAKQSVTFGGGTTSYDAWNSDADRSPATPATDYDPSQRLDTSAIACVSASGGAVVIDHAQVWGYVATGGSPPEVSPVGTIRGRTTPVGERVDPDRISNDFFAELAPIKAPTDGSLIGAVGSSLGVTGTTTRWRCPGIALADSDTLTILGDVTLIVTAVPGTVGISVTDHAGIIVPRGSKLTVYLESDVLIAGDGLRNDNFQPITCSFWGTSESPTAQKIQLLGDGTLLRTLRTLVYAPNANVTVNGNGDVMGAMVARNITLTGDVAFHYDASLADNGNGPFGFGKWNELVTSSDRAAYLPRFAGW